MQDTDPWEEALGREAGGGSELALGAPRTDRSPEAQAADGADPQVPPKVTASVAEQRLSLRVRMLALVGTSGAIYGLSFYLLARLHASPLLSLLVASALTGLGAAYALIEARRLLRPIRMMIAQSDLLATHYCGELPGRSRSELLALARSFDAMVAALLRHAHSSRQLYLAEAQNALDLQRQYALMQMLRNLASAANDGEPLEAALQNSLQEIGSYLDWPVGRLVLLARKKSGAIESVRSHWYAPDRGRFAAFIDACDGARLEAETTGLVGRAQESNLSHWISDLGRLEGWSRREAALACGLRTGFIIPINAGPDTTAFVEFFADHRIEAGAEMLELVEAISVELWNTANRYQSESSLRSPSTRARRLAWIAESIDEAVALTTAEGRVEWANGGMTRLVGLSATQLIGKNIGELLFASDPSSAAECRRHIESRTHVTGFLIAVRADGADTIWYEMQIQPLPDDGAGPSGSFVVVRDVTPQRTAHVTQSEALEALRRERLAAPQLLAEMSQGLRAPLNQVLGVAELLQRTELTERQRGYSDTLCHAADALTRAMNDMLDLAKLQSGQLKLEWTDFDLRPLVERVVERAAARAHAKGVELAYKLSSDLPATVRGDPARLQQILEHLIDNAITFTERGEVILSAEALPEGPAAARGPATTAVRFAVRDTGVGMRPEAIERLFAVPGTVEQPSPARAAGGSGLGLALSRGLAQLMAGHLSASSRIGEGAVFQLYVPLHHAGAGAGAPRPDGLESLAGKRVLIAEDNATHRHILSEQLAALAMDCALAENGRQALQMLRIAANSASPFDIAVVDMKMPFMDGLELADRVRADSSLRALRLIMLTSVAPGEDAGRARAAGVDACLTKPVRPQDLLSTLVAVVGTQPQRFGSNSQGPVAIASVPAPVALPVVGAPVQSAFDEAPEQVARRARRVLEKRVLDEIFAMERNGAKDLLRRLVSTYETSAQSLLQAAELGFAGGDAAAVVQALHTLKLSSANLGALRFSRACGEVEALARQPRLAEAQLRWQALRAEHHSVLQALQELLRVPDPAADRPLEEVQR